MNHWRHVSHISRIMCHQLHLHFLPRMCSTPIVDNAKIRRFPCLASASTHLSWKGFSVISLELGLETHKPNQQKHTTVVPWSWLFYSENAYQAHFLQSRCSKLTVRHRKISGISWVLTHLTNWQVSSKSPKNCQRNYLKDSAAWLALQTS